MFRKFISLIFFILMFNFYLFGGADSLLMTPDAFSESLGSVSTILEYNDLWASFNNQANLFLVKNRGVAVSYKRVSDIFNFFNVAYTEPLENSGTIGAVISYNDYGSLDFITDILLDGTSVSDAKYVARDIIVSIGYGGVFQGLFLYGIGIKYYSSEIADTKISSFIFDLNMEKKLENNVVLGLSVKNLGAKGDNIFPSFVSAGVTFPLMFSKSKNLSINGLVEGKYYIEDEYANDKYTGIVGLQYKLGSFSFNIAGNIYNNKEIFTFGSIGMSYLLIYPMMKIDYSINTLNKDIGINHTISLSYLFPNFQKKKPVKNENIINMDDDIKYNVKKEKKQGKAQEKKKDNNLQPNKKDKKNIKAGKKVGGSRSTKIKKVKSIKEESEDEWED